MKRKIFGMFLILCAMFVNSGTGNIAQSPGVAPTVPRPFSTLNFKIVEPRESVLSLQPIPIILRLTNNSNQPALGYETIGFGKSPLYLYVRKSGSDLRVLIKTLQPIHKLMHYTNVPIDPQESITSKDLLTLGLARYFPEPGRYELQASLANSSGTEFIESNTIIIEIREPIGMDRVAHDLIKNSTFQDHIFSGAEFTQVRSTLERIITLYPETPYAHSAAFALAENYFYSRGNRSKALPYLLKLETDEDFIFADKVKKYLTEIRKEQLSPHVQSNEKP